MLKLAYMTGVEKAFEEEGIEKDAFPKIRELVRFSGLKRLLRDLPIKAQIFGVEHPLATKMLALSGLGGITGAALGDEDGFARGALTGAGIGAGIGAGLHVGEMLGLGRIGRAAKEQLKIHELLNRGVLPRSLPAGMKSIEEFTPTHYRLLQRRMKQLAPRAALGRAIGAGLGGVGAYGLGSAITNELE